MFDYDLGIDRVNDKIRGATFMGANGLSDGSYEAVLVTSNGSLILGHQQDCCESVSIAQVDGDIDKLIGSTIIELSERTSSAYHGDHMDEETQALVDELGYIESVTFTFYTLKTTKGYIDFRWVGESNGYYSESVDFGWVEPKLQQPSDT